MSKRKQKVVKVPSQTELVWDATDNTWSICFKLQLVEQAVNCAGDWITGPFKTRVEACKAQQKADKNS